jgi:PilZ domain
MKPARLVWSGQQTLEGMITDISLGGARIRVVNVAAVPTKFDLEIIEDKISIGCEIVHTGRDYIGVKFVRLARRIRSSCPINAIRPQALVDTLDTGGGTSVPT